MSANLQGFFGAAFSFNHQALQAGRDPAAWLTAFQAAARQVQTSALTLQGEGLPLGPRSDVLERLGSLLAGDITGRQGELRATVHALELSVRRHAALAIAGGNTELRAALLVAPEAKDQIKLIRPEGLAMATPLIAGANSIEDIELQLLRFCETVVNIRQGLAKEGVAYLRCLPEVVANRVRYFGQRTSRLVHFEAYRDLPVDLSKHGNNILLELDVAAFMTFNDWTTHTPGRTLNGALVVYEVFGGRVQSLEAGDRSGLIEVLEKRLVLQTVGSDGGRVIGKNELIDALKAGQNVPATVLAGFHPLLRPAVAAPVAQPSETVEGELAALRARTMAGGFAVAARIRMLEAKLAAAEEQVDRAGLELPDHVVAASQQGIIDLMTLGKEDLRAMLTEIEEELSYTDPAKDGVKASRLQALRGSVSRLLALHEAAAGLVRERDQAREAARREAAAKGLLQQRLDDMTPAPAVAPTAAVEPVAEVKLPPREALPPPRPEAPRPVAETIRPTPPPTRPAEPVVAAGEYTALFSVSNIVPRNGARVKPGEALARMQRVSGRGPFQYGDKVIIDSDKPINLCPGVIAEFDGQRFVTLYDPERNEYSFSSTEDVVYGNELLNADRATTSGTGKNWRTPARFGTFFIPDAIAVNGTGDTIQLRITFRGGVRVQRMRGAGTTDVSARADTTTTINLQAGDALIITHGMAERTYWVKRTEKGAVIIDGRAPGVLI